MDDYSRQFARESFVWSIITYGIMLECGLNLLKQEQESVPIFLTTFVLFKDSLLMQ